MKDNEIIIRVRKGDVDCFRILVERYHQSLLTFIFSLIRDRGRAEDIGQAVFLAFYQHLERFDEEREIPVRAWLYTVARNLTINTMKRERRYVAVEKHAEQSDINPGPLELLIQKEEQKKLQLCLKKLPEPYRSTLLESLQGSSIKEIAAKSLTLPGTVKSRLARAKQKIAALLQTEMRR